ncbi:anti-sigma regulatory factor (plasmid) [Rhodococcus sp. WB1]|uniref:ATP-binding protein n=1 Tax=Rhodococcus sp. WB1 TaxID=1033922 RepID=UPI00081AA852|nr:ATP-binding protein [Rhodococcus sp. WB1]ANZ28570.1 anti-sigma regulatory factor [Rhodococcus sp. WB1]
MHRPPLDPSVNSIVCWHRQLPALASELTVLRYGLSSWLSRVGLAEDSRADVLVAVYEALANAVEHAYRDRAPEVVAVDATYHARQHVLEITVADRGRWRTPTPQPTLPTRGRGLRLIDALTTHTELTTTDTGTTVTMGWTFTTAGPNTPG